MTFPGNACEEADQCQVLSFPPTVAPTKVLLVPLSGSTSFQPYLQRLTKQLRKMGIANKIDDSSARLVASALVEL